mmetsp:Transcript_34728/g.68336  ORF Transcript_34728/g.68336 Transcript_34728/m.68336 type:complete len:119 (-) Transcript_34728:266-622(-)
MPQELIHGMTHGTRRMSKEEMPKDLIHWMTHGTRKTNNKEISKGTEERKVGLRRPARVDGDGTLFSCTLARPGDLNGGGQNPYPRRPPDMLQQHTIGERTFKKLSTVDPMNVLIQKYA